MTTPVIAYAKQQDIPLSAIVCHPTYSEKKGRVTKGNAVAHLGWNKIDPTRKKRYFQTRVDTANDGTIAKAWYIHLRTAGFYVIDVDTKGGKKAEEILLPEMWDALFESSSYVVRTGSGGVHFYYKIPSHNTNDVKTRTKSEKFNVGIEYPDEGDVDILFDSVIVEGSSYDYDGQTYTYQVLKGSIDSVTESQQIWDNVLQECAIITESDYSTVERPTSTGQIDDYVLAIPTTSLSYQEWVKIAFAIYNELGRNGKELFFKWSETYPHNNPVETRTVWESVVKSGTRKEKALFGSIKKVLREKAQSTYYELEEKYSPYNKECIIDTTQPVSEAIDKRVVESDKEAGDLLWNELKDKLIYSKNNFYYKDNNVWVYDIEVVKRAVRRYVMSSNLYRPNAKGVPTIYSQNATNAQNISTVILDNAVAFRDDSWENNIFESSRGKILFTNGYYDLVQGQFVATQSPQFDNSVVFLEHIPYDYNDLYHNNQELFERFFEIPFGKEMGQYYLLKIARAVAGDAEKKFLAGIGSSNTGKSALTSILSNALGGYFGAWNGANICYKSNSQDEAQKLRWLYLLRHKRIVLSNELQVGGQGIDGNMIKKMSNGGLDPIVARQHGGNELSFKIGFLPILFAQDLDKIRPLDDAVMTRLRAIHYQKVYCDNPSNEFELQIDRELDKEVQTEAFRLSFIRLLCDTYYQWIQGGRKEDEPECVKVAVKEVVGSTTCIVDSFLEEFEITNSADDFLPSSEIEKWLTEGKYRVTVTKFGLEMKKYVTIHKLENVFSKDKKIKGKVVKCWIGIRIPQEESNVTVE